MDTSGIKIQEYFDQIKANIDKITIESLERTKQELPQYIEAAKRNGQDALVKKMAKYLKIMAREKILLDYGINKLVHLEDIVKYIDNIPNHYVKFCEVKYFPRVIPMDVMTKLQTCREQGLFDEYYILFTDYTSEELLDEEEKKTRTINRDPILFGSFKGNEDRYYYIADWEDAYCDITFDKFVTKLQEVEPGYHPGTIIEDNDEYINNFLKQMDEGEAAKQRQSQENSRRGQEIYDKVYNPNRRSHTRFSFLAKVINRIFGKNK